MKHVASIVIPALLLGTGLGVALAQSQILLLQDVKKDLPF